MRPPHSSGRDPGSRRSSRRALLTGVVATLVLVLGGVVALLALDGDAASDGDVEPAAGEPGTSETLTVQTRVVRVAGRFRPAARHRLTKQVRTLVERYVADAYVEGSAGFPGFTDRARRLARQDADVTTGQLLADGGDVVLRSGKADLSVLAAGPRRAVGVTASVRLVLGTDAAPRAATVTGRLLLTPAGGGWRIFGYDLASSASRGSAAAGQRGQS